MTQAQPAPLPPGSDPTPSHEHIDGLVDGLYATLRGIARRALSRRPQGIEPTELVHECYLRLAQRSQHAELPRIEFLALSATIIRNLLVDEARSRAVRREQGVPPTLLQSRAVDGEDLGHLDVLALDRALVRLEQLDPRQGRVVVLKFFGGLTLQEIGDQLGISARTVSGEWRAARAWLRRELVRGGVEPEAYAPRPSERTDDGWIAPSGGASTGPPSGDGGSPR